VCVYDCVHACTCRVFTVVKMYLMWLVLVFDVHGGGQLQGTLQFACVNREWGGVMVCIASSQRQFDGAGTESIHQGMVPCREIPF
jgi:hypothetical protein